MIDKTLPCWDLSPVFSSPDGDDFRQALSSVSDLCSSLSSRLSKGCSIASVLDDYNRLLATYETLGAYSSCLLTTDTTCEAYVKAVTDVESHSVAMAQVENLFLQNLVGHEDEIHGEGLRAYSYVLGYMLEDARHRMSLAEETLAADLARSGSSAFERLFDTMTSSIADEGRTLTQLRGDATSPDREVRKSSYEREKRILAQNREPIAACLNAIKGTCLTLEGRQGWTGPLEHSIFTSRISMESLEALIVTLENNLGMFRRYFRTKARLLGLDELAWYDISAPVNVPGVQPRQYSFTG